jgi:hypothetical protein
MQTLTAFGPVDDEDAEAFLHLANYQLPTPDVDSTLWSGRQVFGMFLPKGMRYQDLKTKDGQITASTYGNVAGGLIHMMYVLLS